MTEKTVTIDVTVDEEERYGWVLLGKEAPVNSRVIARAKVTFGRSCISEREYIFVNKECKVPDPVRRFSISVLMDLYATNTQPKRYRS